MYCLLVVSIQCHSQCCVGAEALFWDRRRLVVHTLLRRDTQASLASSWVPLADIFKCSKSTKLPSCDGYVRYVMLLKYCIGTNKEGVGHCLGVYIGNHCTPTTMFNTSIQLLHRIKMTPTTTLILILRPISLLFAPQRLPILSCL